jgi:hypothetical protein
MVIPSGDESAEGLHPCEMCQPEQAVTSILASCSKPHCIGAKSNISSPLISEVPVRSKSFCGCIRSCRSAGVAFYTW